MGQDATFFEAIRTAVLAIEVSAGVKAFARCHMQASGIIDIQALLRIPRFPCAVIQEQGFSLNTSNGKVKQGSFTVTVLTTKPRDHVGDAAIIAAFDLGDLLVTALEYDTDNSIHNEAAGGVQTLSEVSGIYIVARTFTFTYEMRRS